MYNKKKHVLESFPSKSILKVNNKDIKKFVQWRCSNNVVKFEQVSHIALRSSMTTLKKFLSTRVNGYGIFFKNQIYKKITFTKICRYLFKVNNSNTRKRWQICAKLTIKTSEQRYWLRCGALTVNFEHVSHLFLVFLFLILNK